MEFTLKSRLHVLPPLLAAPGILLQRVAVGLAGRLDEVVGFTCSD